MLYKTSFCWYTHLEVSWNENLLCVLSSLLKENDKFECSKEQHWEAASFIYLKQIQNSKATCMLTSAENKGARS